MVADVQAWVNGTMQNDGWMLKSDNLEGTPTSFLGFWSMEGAAANSNLVRLLAATLCRSRTPLAVPEPASLSVLIIAVGAMPLYFCCGARRFDEVVACVLR